LAAPYLGRPDVGDRLTTQLDLVVDVRSSATTGRRSPRRGSQYVTSDRRQISTAPPTLMSGRRAPSLSQAAKDPFDTHFDGGRIVHARVGAAA